MDTINYSALRGNLAGILDKVNDGNTPLMVTRPNGKQVVILSLANYKALEETAYLTASLVNAQRLNQAIAESETKEC